MNNRKPKVIRIEREESRVYVYAGSTQEKRLAVLAAIDDLKNNLHAHAREILSKKNPQEFFKDPEELTSIVIKDLLSELNDIRHSHNDEFKDEFVRKIKSDLTDYRSILEKAREEAIDVIKNGRDLIGVIVENKSEEMRAKIKYAREIANDKRLAEAISKIKISPEEIRGLVNSKSEAALKREDAVSVILTSLKGLKTGGINRILKDYDRGRLQDPKNPVRAAIAELFKAVGAQKVPVENAIKERLLEFAAQAKARDDATVKVILGKIEEVRMEVRAISPADLLKQSGKEAEITAEMSDADVVVMVSGILNQLEKDKQGVIDKIENYSTFKDREEYKRPIAATVDGVNLEIHSKGSEIIALIEAAIKQKQDLNQAQADLANKQERDQVDKLIAGIVGVGEGVEKIKPQDLFNQSREKQQLTADTTTEQITNMVNAILERLDTSAHEKIGNLDNYDKFSKHAEYGVRVEAAVTGVDEVVKEKREALEKLFSGLINEKIKERDTKLEADQVDKLIAGIVGVAEGVEKIKPQDLFNQSREKQQLTADTTTEQITSMVNAILERLDASAHEKIGSLDNYDKFSKHAEYGARVEAAVTDVDEVVKEKREALEKLFSELVSEKAEEREKALKESRVNALTVEIEKIATIVKETLPKDLFDSSAGKNEVTADTTPQGITEMVNAILNKLETEKHGAIEKLDNYSDFSEHAEVVMAVSDVDYEVGEKRAALEELFSGLVNEKIKERDAKLEADQVDKLIAGIAVVANEVEKVTPQGLFNRSEERQQVTADTTPEQITNMVDDILKRLGALAQADIERVDNYDKFAQNPKYSTRIETAVDGVEGAVKEKREALEKLFSGLVNEKIKERDTKLEADQVDKLIAGIAGVANEVEKVTPQGLFNRSEERQQVTADTTPEQITNMVDDILKRLGTLAQGDIEGLNDYNKFAQNPKYSTRIETAVDGVEGTIQEKREDLEKLFFDLIKEQIKERDLKLGEAKQVQLAEAIGGLDTEVDLQALLAQVKVDMQPSDLDRLIQTALEGLKAERDKDVEGMPLYKDFKAGVLGESIKVVEPAIEKMHEKILGQNVDLMLALNARVDELLAEKLKNEGAAKQQQLAIEITNIKTEIDPKTLFDQVKIGMTNEDLANLVKAALQAEWAAKDKQVAGLTNCAEYIAGSLGADIGVVQPAVTDLQKRINAQAPTLTAALEAQIKVLQTPDPADPDPPGIIVPIRPERTKVGNVNPIDGQKYQMPGELQGAWYAITTKPTEVARLKAELQSQLDDPATNVGPILINDKVYRPPKPGETRVSEYLVPTEITKQTGSTLTSCGFVEERTREDTMKVTMMLSKEISKDPDNIKVADFKAMLGIIDQRIRNMIGISPDSKGDISSLIQDRVQQITVECLDLNKKPFSLEAKAYLQYFAAMGISCKDKNKTPIDFTSAEIRGQLVNVSDDKNLDLKTNAGFDACKDSVKVFVDSYRGEGQKQVTKEKDLAVQAQKEPDADPSLQTAMSSSASR